VRRVELRAWCINKCDYFCKITGSTLWVGPTMEQWKDQYSSMHVHFTLQLKYHYSMVDRNNLYPQVPLIEETWATKHWGCWVFVFLLSVIEAHVYDTERFLCGMGRSRWLVWPFCMLA
jgi:hypothetical protein